MKRIHPMRTALAIAAAWLALPASSELLELLEQLQRLRRHLEAD